MKLDPTLKKIFSYALIGLGGSSVMSAIIGIISAYSLVEDSDAQAVGITPRDFLISYLVIGGIGGALLFFGFRLRAKK